MKGWKILSIIFFCSFSSLAYEIALTRIFSISLWYHFAFMIISIAMLGLGASGTVLSLYPKLRNPASIGAYSLLVGLGISLSYLLSNQIPFDPVKLQWSNLQFIYIALYYLLLSMPFFFAGLTVATAFSSFSVKSGLLYGADLIGAGLGSIGVLCLMTLLEPGKVVFILSSIALLPSLFFLPKKFKIVSAILLLLNLSALAFHPPLADVRMSPYKDLQAALRYPGAEPLKTYYSSFSRIDLYRSPAVRFAPGLSLRYLEPLPQQIGFSIDGGQANAITAVDDLKSLAFLQFLPSALPHELGRKENVLILDPKGGLQALVAEYYGSTSIDKIESNPLLIKIMRNELREFSGDIYGRDTKAGLGRGWVRSGGKRFDLIDLSLMGTVPSGSFGISEDYRFTVEAFKEYIDHLKPDGFLSINLFIIPPPRIELRLLHTAITALEEIGVKDAKKQVAAIRSWGSLCLLIKRSPLTLNEIEEIKRFSGDRRFDLIYYPGVQEGETNIYVRMATNEYFHAFEKILNPETRLSFIENYIFDIRPVRDENPFFHYYLKIQNIRAIYKAMGEKWQYFIEEGYILPAVFIQVLFLSLALILLPAIVKKSDTPRHDRRHWSLSYFAFIGLGFMFVEIPLFQKMILPLGNPSYAVAIVLTSILISSGLGSLISYRITRLRSPSITLIISIIILVYSFLLPSASAGIAPYPLLLKIPSVFLFLFPLGLLMGIPFPTGLKILGERDESLIPWAWAINGCFSVLAPLLAVMFAMATGFKYVFWAGAGAYLAAFLISFSLPRRSSARSARMPTARS